MTKKAYVSGAMAALHETAERLHNIDLLTNDGMAYYDATCLEIIPVYTS